MYQAPLFIFDVKLIHRIYGSYMHIFHIKYVLNVCTKCVEKNVYIYDLPSWLLTLSTGFVVVYAPFVSA
jgi:hypothetical protein